MSVLTWLKGKKSYLTAAFVALLAFNQALPTPILSQEVVTVLTYIAGALGLWAVKSAVATVEEKVEKVEKKVEAPERNYGTMRPPNYVPLLALLSLFLAHPVQAQTTKANACFGWRARMQAQIAAIPAPRIWTDPAVTAALAVIVGQNAQILALLQNQGQAAPAAPAAPIGQVYPHYILPQVLNPAGLPLQALNPSGPALQQLSPGGAPLQNLLPNLQGPPLQVLPPDTPPLQQLNPGGLLPGSQLAPNIVVPQVVNPNNPANPIVPSVPPALNPGTPAVPLGTSASAPPRGYQRYTQYYQARIKTRSGKPAYVTVVYSKTFLAKVPVQVQRRVAQPRYRWSPATKRYYRTTATPQQAQKATGPRVFANGRDVTGYGVWLDYQGRPLAKPIQKAPQGYQRYTQKR